MRSFPTVLFVTTSLAVLGLSACGPAPTTPPACTPGETRACLGPGQCPGAQACLLDGSGYGLCDCGSAGGGSGGGGSATGGGTGGGATGGGSGDDAGTGGGGGTTGDDGGTTGGGGGTAGGGGGTTGGGGGTTGGGGGTTGGGGGATGGGGGTTGGGGGATGGGGGATGGGGGTSADGGSSSDGGVSAAPPWSCLTVAPRSWDFGAMKLSCRSATRTFNVYSTCPSDVALTGIGTAGSSELQLAAVPALADGGTLISATGGSGVSLQVSYRPVDLGADVGSLVLTGRLLDGGAVITTTVPLAGTGASTAAQRQAFPTPAQPKTDVLLVVDDSCSMQDKQTQLGSTFQSFIQYASAANLDYRLGVTTTTATQQECIPNFGCIQLNSKGWGGRLVRDPSTSLKFITPVTPNASAVFSRLVAVGTDGSGQELPLAGALWAVTPPVASTENAGFLRDDARLSVIVVSDASDQSPRPPTAYLDLLLAAKAAHQRPEQVRLSGMVPTLAMPPSNCTYDDTTSNSARYDPIIAATFGGREEICSSNWSTAAGRIGDAAFGGPTRLFLSAPADTTSTALTLTINGQAVPSGCASGIACGQACSWWCYDASTNSVLLTGAAPQPGQVVELGYDATCF